MKKRNRIAGPVEAAGAIILGSTWVCDTHGTVNAQGTTCEGCAS
ncbi:hypothetical protein [Actinomadura sp. CNU-125]|nr:hypothetical protein [Actinomadura sp. CNU-125]